jgi:HSP20 family protein
MKRKICYKSIERFSGRFMRRFILPGITDVGRINATSRDGVLVLTTPKLPQLQPKSIEVNIPQKK